VRFQGEIANQPDAVRRLIERLGGKHGKLSLTLHVGEVSSSRLDPEEPFLGDERERLLERHDHRPEVAGRAPSLATPP